MLMCIHHCSGCACDFCFTLLLSTPCLEFPRKAGFRCTVTVARTNGSPAIAMSSRRIEHLAWHSMSRHCQPARPQAQRLRFGKGVNKTFVDRRRRTNQDEMTHGLSLSMRIANAKLLSLFSPLAPVKIGTRRSRFAAAGHRSLLSRPVSRVLSRALRPRDGHSSGTRVTARLKLPTRTRRGPRHSVPIWHCSGWGLAGQRVATLPVRSYRTISPLPVIGFPIHRRCRFCSTFRRVAPPSRYEAPCPVELGLSSKRPKTPRGRPADSTKVYHQYAHCGCANCSAAAIAFAP